MQQINLLSSKHFLSAALEILTIWVFLLFACGLYLAIFGTPKSRSRHHGNNLWKEQNAHAVEVIWKKIYFPRQAPCPLSFVVNKTSIIFRATKDFLLSAVICNGGKMTSQEVSSLPDEAIITLSHEYFCCILGQRAENCDFTTQLHNEL